MRNVRRGVDTLKIHFWDKLPLNPSDVCCFHRQSGGLFLRHQEAGRSLHGGQVPAGPGLQDAQLRADGPGQAGRQPAGARWHQQHERTGLALNTHTYTLLLLHEHVYAAPTSHSQAQRTLNFKHYLADHYCLGFLGFKMWKSQVISKQTLNGWSNIYHLAHKSLNSSSVFLCYIFSLFTENSGFWSFSYKSVFYFCGLGSFPVCFRWFCFLSRSCFLCFARCFLVSVRSCFLSLVFRLLASPSGLCYKVVYQAASLRL